MSRPEPPPSRLQPMDLDSPELMRELYENAPCGYLSTLADGTIAKINDTLLGWLGRTREELVGRQRFSDLLTVGGKLYHETHFAPLLRMQGEISGVAFELRTADGTRIPVLVTSVLKEASGGRPAGVRTTVFDARERRSYERELLRARQAAEHDRERLQRLVTSLQRSLLPSSLPTPPGTETAAHYRMASPDIVGGDFYDLFPLPDRRWGFFLGDVCGKGVDAAAITSLARYTLRAAAVYDPDPASVLGNLNTVLYQEYLADAGSHRYCTAVFGMLTPDSGGVHTVTLVGGGHPPALLLRADGSADYQPTGRGPIIGVFPGATFSTRTLHLRPGDTLLLYTDGLTDARVEHTDRYGDDALLGFARSLAPSGAGEVVNAVIGLLDTFGDGLQDDVAVIAIGMP